MDSFRPCGLGVALVTPFKSDKSIDFEALDAIVEGCIKGGCDYLVVLGTTGEAATLAPEEQKQVRDAIRARVKGRVPLVLGLGGNDTASLTRDIKEADLEGFSAILSVTPFYNKPSQRGLIEHYSALAKASPLPIILYNVPGRTGVNMTAATTLALARAQSNIIGVKEASGNMAQVGGLLRERPDGFFVLSGDDALALPMISMGADGVISVIGNALPGEFAALVHHALAGRTSVSAAIHSRLGRLLPLLFEQGNPAGVKCALSVLGLCKESLRLPLTPVDDDLRGRIADEVKSLASEK